MVIRAFQPLILKTIQFVKFHLQSVTFSRTFHCPGNGLEATYVNRRQREHCVLVFPRVTVHVHP